MRVYWHDERPNNDGVCAQFGSVWWDPTLDQVTSSRGTGMDVSTAKDAPLPSQFNFPPFPIIFCFSQKMELVWIQLKRLSFFFLPYFISPFHFLASSFCCSFICKLFDIQISVHILLRRLCLFSNVPSGTKHGFCEFGRFLQPLKKATV